MAEDDDIKTLSDKVNQLTKAVEGFQQERSSLINTVGLLAGAVNASAMGVPAGSLVGAAASLSTLEGLISKSDGKIDREETGRRLLLFLGEYCNYTPVYFWHELEGVPVLGLDSQKKAGMKGPLESYVYDDVGLKLKANDIPPLETVAELRDKIWKRIPDANKK